MFDYLEIAIDSAIESGVNIPMQGYLFQSLETFCEKW